MIKVATLLVLVAVVTFAGRHGQEFTDDGGGASTPTGSAYQQVLDRVSTTPGCGSGGRTMALVRTPGGREQLVSFARGWAVYNHRAPGTFLRVCAGD